ncbi:MAG: extra-cytoplasmic solute receptor family protein [Hyphomicrobiales bacterium]|nr:extra-cytoplasmic solute receptor family protein [Hyphomicrobiales bacterium]
MRRALLGVVTGPLALLALTASAAAQDARAFYRDNTVRIIVGVGPGGGFDAYARMVAPHLGKALGTTVVVENQPGAGGLVALNRIATGEPDGLRIMLANGTPAALGQLLNQSNIRYDLTKMAQLGVVSTFPLVWMASKASGLEGVAQAMQRPKVRWGGVGPTDGPADAAKATCHALEMKCDVVLGYKGSAEIALALERGEMDSLYVSDNSAVQFVQAGNAKAIAVLSRTRSPLLPDTPTIFEQTRLREDQEWWLNFRIAINDMGRILLTTGGVRPDRLQYLRAAIAAVLTDPEVIAEGEKTGRPIGYQTPEAVDALVTKTLGGVSEADRARLRAVILPEN